MRSFLRVLLRRSVTQLLPASVVAVLLLIPVPALAQAGAQALDSQGVSVPHLVAPASTRPVQPRPVLPSQRFGLDLTAEIVPVILDPLDTDALLAEDATLPPSPMRIGVNRATSLASTDGDAALIEVPGHGSVWSISVVSPTAQALGVLFNYIDLPPGAELWAYAPKSPRQAVGPYTGAGPRGSGRFWSNTVMGDEVRVEYFLPESATDAGFFLIEELVHYYRGFAPMGAGGDNQTREGPCHNDVLCYPEWHPLHNATARIHYVDGEYWWLCSATLLNTAAEDYTPYLLTAKHCVDTESEADDLKAWWFYQTQSCDGAPASYTERDTDADVLWTSNAVDITVLMIQRKLPSGLTWSGWTTAGFANGTDLATIGHPDASMKKITFGDKITHSFGDPTHYFGITFTSGTIEGGSSGSGLYVVASKLFIGVLSHAAVPTDCDNPDGPAGYGKLRWAYDNDSTFANLLDAGSDDSLEENDACETPHLLVEGTYTDLIVKSVDDDWYSVVLNPYEEITVTLTHTNDWGDIDIAFRDSCDGSALLAKTGPADVKSFTYQNGSTQKPYYIRVWLGNGDDDTRNQYDLDISIQPGGGPPDPPANVAATDGTLCDQVQVSWDSVPEATEYTIWRGFDYPNDGVELDTVTASPFLDTTTAEELIYTYWLIAGNAYGQSDPSAADTGYSDCPGTCHGDIDGDGDIGLSDLAQLLANYGIGTGMTYEDGDLDGDGDVDLSDLAALLAVYGTSCP